MGPNYSRGLKAKAWLRLRLRLELRLGLWIRLRLSHALAKARAVWMSPNQWSSRGALWVLERPPSKA